MGSDKNPKVSSFSFIMIIYSNESIHTVDLNLKQCSNCPNADKQFSYKRSYFELENLVRIISYRNHKRLPQPYGLNQVSQRIRHFSYPDQRTNNDVSISFRDLVFKLYHERSNLELEILFQSHFDSKSRTLSCKSS